MNNFEDLSSTKDYYSLELVRDGFTPGEEVIGSIRMYLAQRRKIEMISITASGIEGAKWQVQKSKKENIAIKTRYPHLVASKNIPIDRKPLVGTISLPFRFKIPSNCPPSISVDEKQQLSISYMVKAVITFDRKQSISIELPFWVYAAVDGQGKHHVECVEVDITYCCCFRSGKASTIISLEKASFDLTKEQSIRAQVSVDGRTSRSSVNIYAELVRTISCLEFVEKSTICKFDGFVQCPAQEKIQDDVCITIPTRTPTISVKAKKLSITYNLLFEICVWGGKKERVEIPINLYKSKPEDTTNLNLPKANAKFELPETTLSDVTLLYQNSNENSKQTSRNKIKEGRRRQR